MDERALLPNAESIERFRASLDALIAPEARIGAAVSGGPDSLALLLLVAAARPGRIEAATVDHGLRPEARDEATLVEALCDRLGISHSTLTARWTEMPETAIQERARHQRYRLLGYWAEERGLSAIATAHHADDQAETVLMRLARGSGVRGLAGIRPQSVTPGSHVQLIRPLLRWRRGELADICAASAIAVVADPSNLDQRFERVRVRHSLADCEWLDAAAVAQSAANLADADLALDWAMKNEWRQAVHEKRGVISYQRGSAPVEIARRIIIRAVRSLANEGNIDLRGREVDQLLAALERGDIATLRGVHCAGGREWRFTIAPSRRQ